MIQPQARASPQFQRGHQLTYWWCKLCPSFSPHQDHGAGPATRACPGRPRRGATRLPGARPAPPPLSLSPFSHFGASSSRAPPSFFLFSLQPPRSSPARRSLPLFPGPPSPRPLLAFLVAPPPRPFPRARLSAAGAGHVCPRGTAAKAPTGSWLRAFPPRSQSWAPVSPNLCPPVPAPRGAAQGAARSPSPVLNSSKVFGTLRERERETTVNTATSDQLSK